MLLSARALTQSDNCNQQLPALNVSWTSGDVIAVPFQLIDLSKQKAINGFNPPGLRYCPAVGATLQCVIQNLDDGKVITRFATQPFSTLDTSIWLLQILSTDVISGCPDMVLTLTEPTGGMPATVVTTGRVQQMLCVAPSVTNAVPVQPALSWDA